MLWGLKLKLDAVLIPPPPPFFFWLSKKLMILNGRERDAFFLFLLMFLTWYNYPKFSNSNENLCRTKKDATTIYQLFSYFSWCEKFFTSLMVSNTILTNFLPLVFFYSLHEALPLLWVPRQVLLSMLPYRGDKCNHSRPRPWEVGLCPLPCVGVLSLAAWPHVAGAAVPREHNQPGPVQASESPGKYQGMSQAAGPSALSAGGLSQRRKVLWCLLS